MSFQGLHANNAGEAVMPADGFCTVKMKCQDTMWATWGITMLLTPAIQQGLAQLPAVIQSLFDAPTR